MDTSPRSEFMHPKKLVVYLFSVSISMFFLSLSSAHIVRRAEGNWLQFDMPPQLLWSTVLIVISSVTLYLAQRAVKQDNQGVLKIGMILTAVMAFGFCLLQYQAAGHLFDNGVIFGGTESNPAGSFFYIFVWAHVFHVVFGVIYLAIVLVKSLRGVFNSGNKLSVDMFAIYWHFLMVLWVYLYLFLYFNH